MIEDDHNPGAGADSDNWNLSRSSTTKALIFDVTAQQSSTTAATRFNTASQLELIQLGVSESQAVSEVEGEDLDAWNILNGNTTQFNSSTTDNARIVYSSVYALDPFMMNPEIRYDEPFGLSGKVARKLKVKFAADGNNIDDKRLAIGQITSTTATSGYVSFHENNVTSMTNGSNEWTEVPQPGKLLAALLYETTSAADVTADGAHRSDQTIEEIAIAIDRKDVFGPVYTTTLAALAGRYEQDLTDEGYSIWNFGIGNKGSLGVPSAPASMIPSNMEIRAKGGDAGDAAKIYAVTLNTEV